MRVNPATLTALTVILSLLFFSSVGFAANTGSARSGDSFHWISPIGGAFAAPANWEEGTPPQWDDTAIFDLASVPGYTVNFYSAIDNDRLLILTDRITFDLGNATYNLLRESDDPDGLAVTVGTSTGEVAQLHVTNGTLHSVGWIYVGYLGGEGSLDIHDGGHVTTDRFCDIGSWDGSSVGRVSVAGTDATFDLTEYLQVGYEGDGTLEITAGGQVTNTRTDIGNQPDSQGSVTVSDSGSNWSSSAHVIVGRYGQGSLSVDDGATASCTFSHVGEAISGVGDVLVSGDGSAWLLSGRLNVGLDGNGTLHIADGATVESDYGIVGDHPGAVGDVVVTGVGSLWSAATTLRIGPGGSGTLTVANGAAVEVGDWLWVGTGDDTLDVSGAGYVTVGSGTETPESSAVLVRPDGYLYGGGGAVVGDIDNHGTVVALRGSGVFSNSGSYTQDGAAAYGVEIGGREVGIDYGQLAIAGTSWLDGTLIVALADYFVPADDDVFNVMTCPSRLGVFSNIQCAGGYDCGVSYTDTAVTVSMESNGRPLHDTQAGYIGNSGLSSQQGLGLHRRVYQPMPINPQECSISQLAVILSATIMEEGESRPLTREEYIGRTITVEFLLGHYTEETGFVPDGTVPEIPDREIVIQDHMLTDASEDPETYKRLLLGFTGIAVPAGKELNIGVVGQFDLSPDEERFAVPESTSVRVAAAGHRAGYPSAWFVLPDDPGQPHGLVSGQPGFSTGTHAMTVTITGEAGSVPAVSTWGLLTMTLLMLVAGTLVYRWVPFGQSAWATLQAKTVD